MDWSTRFRSFLNIVDGSFALTQAKYRNFVQDKVYGIHVRMEHRYPLSGNTGIMQEPF